MKLHGNLKLISEWLKNKIKVRFIKLLTRRAFLWRGVLFRATEQHVEQKSASLCIPLSHISVLPPHLFFFFFFFFLLFCFLGLHSQHMEVPRPGVELELKLLAYAIITQNLSIVCNLHHS